MGLPHERGHELCTTVSQRYGYPLNPDTLLYYLIAGGVSVSLSAVLLFFAHHHPDTRLLKEGARAILMAAVALVVSAYGPELPRWMTVMGSNLLLIVAAVMLHAGMLAHIRKPATTADRLGWAVVALAAVPFWYWGLVVPNGLARSAVFSVAVAAVCSRTAQMLFGANPPGAHNRPLRILAVLFGVIAVWMAARGVWYFLTWASLVAEPAAGHAPGANPTTWITVFWYIVLVALMTATFLWLQFHDRVRVDDDLLGVFRHRLSLLWSGVLIFVLVFMGEAGILYTNFYQSEKERLIRDTEVTNDAFVEHSLQVAQHADSILYAVRGFYAHTRSIPVTEAFINALSFDKSVIDNIYLIDARGRIVISHDPAARGRSVADREYFLFHQATSDDEMFIAPVESGRVTGKFHFRITRRIDNRDGTFGGLVLATVNPESFARYYRRQITGTQKIATLAGTRDRKFRARVPELPADRWQVPIESPLWAALQAQPAGRYENTSGVDDIARIFVYKKVGQLPLVMVTGFAEGDLSHSIVERLRWVALVALVVLAVILLLAVLLSIEIHRRNEQDRFISMLNHELKTPLSVVRMALGMENINPATRQHAQQAAQDIDAVVERSLWADRIRERRCVTLEPCCVVDVLSGIGERSATPQRIRVSGVSGDPALTVVTDRQYLQIILGNLLDNALKYSPPQSTVRVDVTSHHHKRREGVLVSLCNAVGGAGRPDPQHLFGKYYRSSGAHGKTGSGLGLYLSREMARLLGGWLRYRPDNAEVKFELWLPR